MEIPRSSGSGTDAKGEMDRWERVQQVLLVLAAWCEYFDSSDAVASLQPFCLLALSCLRLPATIAREGAGTAASTFLEAVVMADARVNPLSMKEAVQIGGVTSTSVLDAISSVANDVAILAEREGRNGQDREMMMRLSRN